MNKKINYKKNLSILAEQSCRANILKYGVVSFTNHSHKVEMQLYNQLNMSTLYHEYLT